MNISAAGRIDANVKGFAGGPTLSKPGYGPGRGLYAASRNSGGAGYGGKGGSVNGGSAYGIAETPDRAGSGGAGVNDVGGNGGGAIFITASANVSVDGSITANGGQGGSGYGGDPGGGGSGGTVAIACETISGSGIISADGSASGLQIVSSTYYRNGGGGGGRIAITFDEAAQSAVTAELVISAAEGRGYPSKFGEPGTIIMTSTNLLNDRAGGGRIIIPGWTEWTYDTLTVTNGTLVFPEGFDLTVNGDVNLLEPGALLLTNSAAAIGGGLNIVSTNAPSDNSVAQTIIYGGPGESVSVAGTAFLSSGNLALYGLGTNCAEMKFGGDFQMTNLSALTVSARPLSDAAASPGIALDIGGDMSISSNSWVYVLPHQTNGACPVFTASNLYIAAYGGFHANSNGYAGGAAGGQGLGSGGGTGGTSAAAGGTAYGEAHAPVEPGSGGGAASSQAGGAGGGRIRITAHSAIVMNGIIRVTGGGGTSSAGNPSGGGAGGGIFLDCIDFSGAGSMEAGGGIGGWQVAVPDRYGGGGGGGRIAVAYRRRYDPLLPLRRLNISETPPDTFTGTTSAAGGAGGGASDGGTGTVRFIEVLAKGGTSFSFH